MQIEWNVCCWKQSKKLNPIIILKNTYNSSREYWIKNFILHNDANKSLTSQNYKFKKRKLSKEIWERFDYMNNNESFA